MNVKMIGFLLTLVVIVLFACRGGAKGDSGIHDDPAKNKVIKTTVEIIDSVYNFGKIKSGGKVTFSYRFKNTGKKPLVIKSVEGSCGCTIPEKPDHPVEPGDTGVVRVAFNSDGVEGVIRKNVQIISNAEPDFPLLLLEGEVTMN